MLLKNSYRKNSLELIKMCLSNKPELIERCKFHLHSACENKMPIDVIDFLLNILPDSIRIKDSNNKFPLQLAIENNSPIQVIMKLYDANKDAIINPENYFNFENGFSNDLYNFLVLIIGKDSHSLTKDNLEKILVNFLDSWYKNSIEDFMSLIKLYPNIMTEKFSKNMTILHILSDKYKINESEYFYDFFEKIINTNKNNAFEKDDLGRLPLHIALEKRVCNRILQLFISTNPEAIRQKDNNGNLPIHIDACQNYFQHFKVLSQIYPESLEEKNDKGQLLLHTTVLQSNKKEELHIIKIILNLYPEQINQNDKNGNTPLDIAILKYKIELVELFLYNNAKVDIMNSERCVNLQSKMICRDTKKSFLGCKQYRDKVILIKNSFQKSKVLCFFKILYHKFIFLGINSIFDLIQTLLHEEVYQVNNYQINKYQEFDELDK